jgi:hypothetical protein
MHSTSNLEEDGYMGSGKLIGYSIRKHGKKNHIKEILEFLPNRVELAAREKEIVNKELLSHKECLNLKEGGDGGRVLSDESFNNFQTAGTLAFQDKIKNDPDFRASFSESISLSNKEIKRGWGKNPNYDWTGRKHSPETIEKMKQSAIGRGTGQDNSQWGTCWINKDGDALKIKADRLSEFLDQGWLKGRKQK